MTKARDLASASIVPAAVSVTELGYIDGVTSAIQTQMNAKAATAATINPTIVDAKGDLIAATAADTVSRLAIGANDTVLTADSAEATGMKWAAAAASGKSYALLNSGGTTLSGTSVTLSGLAGVYSSLILLFNRAGANADDCFFQVQINSFTTPYNNVGGYYNYNTSYSTSLWNESADSTGGAWTITKSAVASGYVSGYLNIEGCNTSGVKIATFLGITGAGNNLSWANFGAGAAADTNAVSSVKIICAGGSFDQGKVYLYGAV